MNPSNVPTGPNVPTAPHRVEFLHHPHPGYPHLTAWGIRIDDTDLRVLVAEATRELWDQELDEDDDTPQEREEFLLGHFAPLYLDDDADADGARARAHFLGEAPPELRDRFTGALCLLSCPCGIDACNPLLATVRVTQSEVTWSGFYKMNRPQWGELPLGPYVFARPAYDEALAAPVPLAEDPLAPLLGKD
ncbi:MULTISPECIES: hypothetical protein [unclassified Streptomyces]|uniref:hypothetical protein n=1 Tax=unclassified Streptomyces TaxID=2593676 RepID=UPI002E2DA101|nr:hypothetical protein [Streptomyces sp. NBC_01439]